MPNWARVLTLLLVLAGWSGSVAVSLLAGEIPSVALLGVPAGAWLALRGTAAVARRRRTTPTESDASGAEPPADTEP